jgi:hypothetical protein
LKLPILYIILDQKYIAPRKDFQHRKILLCGNKHRVSAMQFRMAPHQIKKGKHESNTSDVLRTGEGKNAMRGQELLSRFRRLHAGGKEMLVGEGAA